MLATIVYVSVKASCVDDAIEARRIHHETSITEPGNCRFDVLHSDSEPCSLVLYDAWTDAAAARSHKLTGHYLQWRDTAAGWLEIPRECVPCTALTPISASQP